MAPETLSRSTQVRYEDNYYPVNNFAVMKLPASKGSIEGYGSQEAFLTELQKMGLFGAQSFTGALNSTNNSWEPGRTTEMTVGSTCTIPRYRVVAPRPRCAQADACVHRCGGGRVACLWPAGVHARALSCGAACVATRARAWHLSNATPNRCRAACRLRPCAPTRRHCCPS
jgi:PsbP